MPKVTFRENDDVYEKIKHLWEGEDAPLDAKSEFYRFARDFTLNELSDNYNPQTDNYKEVLDILEDTEAGAVALASAQQQLGPGYDMALTIKSVLDDKESSEEERLASIEDVTDDFLKRYATDSLYVEHRL